MVYQLHGVVANSSDSFPSPDSFFELNSGFLVC